MRLLKFGLVALASMLAWFTPASAETRTVPANKASVIGFYYTYVRDTCHYGSKPTFKLTQAPAHGSITSKWQSYRMGRDSRNCAGKQAYGTMIVYTPNRGFQGTDSVEFDLIGSGIYPGLSYGLSRDFHIDINVSGKAVSPSRASKPSRGVGKVASGRCLHRGCKKS